MDDLEQLRSEDEFWQAFWCDYRRVISECYQLEGYGYMLVKHSWN